MKHGPTRMLYKYPGEHFLNGDYFDYIIVPESETETMLDCGWFLTTLDAKASAEQEPEPEPQSEEKPRSIKDLTEDEKLEIIAAEGTELSIRTKFNITNYTLRKLKGK